MDALATLISSTPKISRMTINIQLKLAELIIGLVEYNMEPLTKSKIKI